MSIPQANVKYSRAFCGSTSKSVYATGQHPDRYLPRYAKNNGRLLATKHAAEYPREIKRSIWRPIDCRGLVIIRDSLVFGDMKLIVRFVFLFFVSSTTISRFPTQPSHNLDMIAQPLLTPAVSPSKTTDAVDCRLKSPLM